MNRRRFIRNISLAGTGAMMLEGIPVKLMALNPTFSNAIMQSAGDRVLVLVQLHGGNDGLNTVIPIDQYNLYYNLRANIAIPDHGTRRYLTLGSDFPDVGLHPDMQAFKALLDEGRASIIQNVGYENMNLSHFRGRDIIFMGGDSNDHYSSGWMGRYLDTVYPGYPEGYPNEVNQDPPALELGNNMSLAYHRETGIPVGFNVESPEAFYHLINGVGGDPLINFPDSYAGDELRYLMQFEGKSNDYADRLRQVYNNGTNAAEVSYPETYPLNAPARFLSNPLSGQLRLISRLISGGIKTRLFLVRIGLFDTHAAQVEQFNTSLGGHAALLYHISAAMKAFQDDLKSQQLEDRVLSMTFTEFGRRPASNASYGTDHGTATPVMMFGSALKGGIIGNNPDLTDLPGGNLRYGIDYRQLYTTVLTDWFGASSSAIEAVNFTPWMDKKLDLLDPAYVSVDKFIVNGWLKKIYPNPVYGQATIGFYVEYGDNVSIALYNLSGSLLKELSRAYYVPGHHEINYDFSGLARGTYIIRLSSKGKSTGLKMIKN